MDRKTTAEAFQHLIRQYFPSVWVLHDTNRAPYPDIYDVFFIPDEVMQDYIRFDMELLPDLALQAGLPDVTLIPHWTSDTLKYYPQVCQRVEAEQAAAHAASK